MQELLCDLRRWLPEDLLVEVFELPCSLSSTSAAVSQALKTTSPATSPQVAPLESRLHSYKLIKPKAETQAAAPIRVIPLFRRVNFEAEGPTATRKIEKEVHLFDCLAEQGIFAEAVQTIQSFRSKTPSLRADARAFAPSASNKENTLLIHDNAY